MPWTAEQERKGKLIARRRGDMKQPELAKRAGVSERTVQNIEAGDTWYEPTVGKIMDALGMTDDDFGPPPTADMKALEDARLWNRFPEDVRINLLQAGIWLTAFPEGAARKRAFDSLSEWMDQHRPNG